MARIELSGADAEQMKTFWAHIEQWGAKRLALYLTEERELVLRPTVTSRIDTVLVAPVPDDVLKEVLARAPLPVFRARRIFWADDRYPEKTPAGCG